MADDFGEMPAAEMDPTYVPDNFDDEGPGPGGPGHCEDMVDMILG